MATKITNVTPEISGVPIDPQSVYDAEGCMKILGLKSRSSLRRYIDRGFPLKAIQTGRALGSEIIDWWKSQPSEKQARGSASPKRQTKTRRAAAAK